MPIVRRSAVALSPILHGNSKGIGSGFLARKSGYLWLVTAAHVASGAQPSQKWATWPDQLAVVFAPGNQAPLALFGAFGTARKPNFAYGVDPASGAMSDFIFISINPASAADDAGPLGAYRVFDVIPPPTLVETDEIIGFGYPPPLLGNTWPYSPPATWKGTFLRRDGDKILANGKVVGGFSGGPVMKLTGQLIGMCIGSDLQADGSEAITIVPADYLWALLPDKP